MSPKFLNNRHQVHKLSRWFGICASCRFEAFKIHRKGLWLLWCMLSFVFTAKPINKPPNARNIWVGAVDFVQSDNCTARLRAFFFGISTVNNQHSNTLWVSVSHQQMRCVSGILHRPLLLFKILSQIISYLANENAHGERESRFCVYLFLYLRTWKSNAHSLNISETSVLETSIFCMNLPLILKFDWNRLLQLHMNLNSRFYSFIYWFHTEISTEHFNILPKSWILCIEMFCCDDRSVVVTAVYIVFVVLSATQYSLCRTQTIGFSLICECFTVQFSRNCNIGNFWLLVVRIAFVAVTMSVCMMDIFFLQPWYIIHLNFHTFSCNFLTALAFWIALSGFIPLPRHRSIPHWNRRFRAEKHQFQLRLA